MNNDVNASTLNAGHIDSHKVKAPTWVYVLASIFTIGLTYLGIPALVWWLLSTIVPAYTFGYWSTVGLYVAWRLVRGPLVRIPAKKAGV